MSLRFSIISPSIPSIPTLFQKDHCSTSAPMWLDLTEPLPEVGQTVTSRACSHWGSSCCDYAKTVSVHNCGEFLVYHLTSTSCNRVYCAVRDNWLYDYSMLINHFVGRFVCRFDWLFYVRDHFSSLKYTLHFKNINVFQFSERDWLTWITHLRSQQPWIQDFLSIQ